MNQTESSWTLTGSGFSTACLHRLDRVRPYIPSHFSIQTVFPGHTLGGYYGLHYDNSPIGPYDELIVFPALVTFGGKVGCYVSHSYVNNERALQGGFQSWRWPRELRRIVTKFENHAWKFDLYEAGEVVFAARGRILTPAFPLHFSVPFIDDAGGQVVWYSGLFDTQLHFSTARIKINADCQFGQLARAQRLLSVCFKSLHVVLGEPSMVQERPIPQPAYATPAISTNTIAECGIGNADAGYWIVLAIRNLQSAIRNRIGIFP
ncbi:MAG: acetoacetate decarboxylase family protein [Acidobacteria bacterium]|nr:acetoacetate decarboxylase family protein [Acidobacteriota bacterium]